ncbi:adenylate/guanylate cyclase domain-containing protein [Pseudoalteromonas denitrificans]|uniref:Adenylate and Guanylate cyclase catalytic domain-containing protein n=1 Tax=Pseudoalteromonas denitrificans DSM 6059 TaxID=1123010 RepID=A0A1I1FHG9_9GAMM|nr:adenylate/guanylate cyclase domain-containing protein [Pseudoalteromonas denitrificans]SFB98432.1 Adenylate and Guanylate cyclase catalytic domain-containing protein [Pseudoalteromonas denitrificans DSM 6059]
MNQLQSLLSEYFHQTNDNKKSEIEEVIWSKYGVRGHILIMDMSGFSLVTQRYGIVYYLAMIEKMRVTVAPIITSNSGVLIKFVADNVFASFDCAEDAINTAVEINLALAEINKKSSKQWDICVSTGIDFGRYLRTDEGDVFGDAVNCASKLGEDIAHKNEILVSEKAFMTIDKQDLFIAEHVKFKISGISLEAYSIATKS